MAAQEQGWLEIRSPIKIQLPTIVEDISLDPGETAAIALALELSADVLLIDERAGFRAAQALHIRTVGLLGILLQAKNEEMIQQVKPLLNQLRDEIGFWISQSLYERVLRLAGEEY